MAAARGGVETEAPEATEDPEGKADPKGVAAPVREDPGVKPAAHREGAPGTGAP